MADNHITEILPDLDKMPDWAREAFLDGQFFDVAFKRVAKLEATIKQIGELPDKWRGSQTMLINGMEKRIHNSKDQENCAEELEAILEKDNDSSH